MFTSSRVHFKVNLTWAKPNEILARDVKCAISLSNVAPQQEVIFQENFLSEHPGEKKNGLIRTVLLARWHLN